MNPSSTSTSIQMETWPINRLIPYVRNPRKNDQAVERMCASLREFGFKIPCLVRSDGEVVDGHLRLKGARKLGITEIPVILCDEWTQAQVKAFRLLVNRSVTWADWDEKLLALELQEIQGLDFNLDLTGFDVPESEDLLAVPKGNEEVTPPLPHVATSRADDLWLLGGHRLLCGDATSPSSSRNPRFSLFWGLKTTASGAPAIAVCEKRDVVQTCPLEGSSQ
jgi:ParB-like chromosome segregation protein Spo0J